MGVIANWSLLYRMLTNTLLMEIETYHEIDLSANSLTLRTKYLHASWKKKIIKIEGGVMWGWGPSDPRREIRTSVHRSPPKLICHINDQSAIFNKIPAHPGLLRPLPMPRNLNIEFLNFSFIYLVYPRIKRNIPVSEVGYLVRGFKASLRELWDRDISRRTAESNRY